MMAADTKGAMAPRLNRTARPGNAAPTAMGVRRIMISARFDEPLLGQPLSHPGYRALTPRYGCSGLRPAGGSLFPLREPWLAQGAHARLAKVALHHPGDVGVG